MHKASTLELGQKITKYRKRLGWNVTEAAKIMKVQRTSLSRWEHGHEMPSGDNLTKLHDHLSMPIGIEEGAPLASVGLEAGYQLVLPFDQPANLELRVVRKTPQAVQLELKVKGLAT